MNVLLTFDNNYSQHAAVTIVSFCYHNKGKHNFYVLSDGIDNSNQHILESLAKKYDSTILFISIDANMMAKFPIGKNTANTYINLAAYFRLFMVEALPKEIDMILYLDCDILVNDNLEDLWLSSFEEDCCIKAVEDDPRNTIENCKRLGYSYTDSYFNSGMMLVNLNALRHIFSYDKVCKFINSHSILYHDQDVLNGLLHDKKRFLPLRFNLLDTYIIKKASIPQRYMVEAEEAIHHPAIIHFSGPLKPWFKECKNPYKDLYYRYLKMTPWKEYKPVNKYKTLKEKEMFWLKNSVKFILELLHVKYYSFVKI